MPFKSPKAIVEAACTAGCAKGDLPLSKQLVMGFLAGAYIAFGGLLAIVVGRGSPALAEANPGLARFLFGAVFPVGLMLVVIAGSELFTGNCGVITPACLTGAARWSALLRNWVWVYIGNFIGSLFVALFIAYWTNIVNGGMLGDASAAIAESKISMSWGVLILRGIGCNWLVCLAVWLAISADDVAGKILGIWFPIMAFVALGLEHSIANMFFIPLGMLNGADVSIGQFLFGNLLPVTIGNIIGGAGFVGGIYWWIYGRD
ncbi:MAG: formate/nitrite transporter family protein [Anaerolineae bacterium]